MSDFQAFNGLTHPIVKLVDDWNNLLDHGLVKTASYIVRVNGALYEAINGNTGKLLTSNADAATVIQAAVTAASAGGKVFIKNGNYSIVGGMTLINYANIEGEDRNKTILTLTTNAVPLWNIPTLTGITIKNIRLVGTGVGDDGIHALNSTDLKFIDMAFSGSVNNILLDGCTNVTITGNVMSAVTDEIHFDNVNTNIFIENNIGYVTENSGTATIDSGATSEVVAHGCSYTPDAADITVVPMENPTNDPGMIYVDTIGAASFTIHCLRDPGASNLDVGWSVRRIP